MKWFLRLFGKKEPTQTDILDPFPPLDKEDVRRSTHLIEQAQIDGANEHPASASDEETSTEKTIRKKCEKRRREYMQNYEKRQESYRSMLNKIHESWSVDVVQDKLQALGDRVISEGKADQGPLAASADKLKSLADELHHFRHEHRLMDRTPVYQDPWTCWLMMLVAFFIEVVITVFLLRESGGLQMVLLLSTIYCVLNCWLPLFIANNLGGRWISYRWTQYPRKQLTGWIVIISVIVFGVGLNLLMGHYRSVALEFTISPQQDSVAILTELNNQISKIGVTALHNFLASPFGINDVWSVLLALAGIFIFLFGLWEGFTKDDRYPEYGEKARRYSEQRERYDAEVSELIEEIQELRKKGADNIESEKRKLVDSFNRDPELRSNIYSFQGRCERAYQALSDDYQELIHEYRQINIKFRKTPTPSHFRRNPQLSRVTIPTFELPSDNTADRKEILIKQLSESATKLNQQFVDMINNIKPSQEIVPLDPLTITIT